MFSSSSFRVLGSRFRSLVHLELIFVQGNRHGSNFIFLYVESFSQHHILKMFSFFQHMLLVSLLNAKWLELCMLMCVFNFVPLV